jgi:integrase
VLNSRPCCTCFVTTLGNARTTASGRMATTRRPPCPVYYEGVTGQGTRVRPAKALIDPRTGQGVRDWSRANEIIRDLEAPTPVIVALPKRYAISEAAEHFNKLKLSKSRDVQRKTKNLMKRLQEFMAAAPRRYEFIDDVKFHDLTDWCGEWTGAEQTKIRDLGILTSFTKFCYQCDFTRKNVGDGLFKRMNFQNTSPPKPPFEPEELVRLWDAAPYLPDEYGRLAQPIAKQTEAFAYVQRYTGLDVSTTMSLEKSHVRGNEILTRRLKTKEEVWTVVPPWVIKKLWAAPHDSRKYFFWSGEGSRHTRSSKWFERLRKLLDLAGLEHRTPHNFRHTFACYHLLEGTPIDQVARMLGHKNMQTTMDSYAGWVKARREQLAASQRKIWETDPEHIRQMKLAEQEDLAELGKRVAEAEKPQVVIQ